MSPTVYIVARKETIDERIVTYYRSIYSCGCEREGATPLRTRVIRCLQYGLSLQYGAKGLGSNP